MSIRCWASSLILTVFPATMAFGQDGQSSAPATRDEKTWTFSAGAGSSKAWNLVGLSKELFASDHASVFVTAGLGEMILGAGVTLYSNREGSGVVASAVAGTGLQVVVAYRWNLGKSNYFSLGAAYIKVAGFSNADPGVAPVVAYEHRF